MGSMEKSFSSSQATIRSRLNPEDVVDVFPGEQQDGEEDVIGGVDVDDVTDEEVMEFFLWYMDPVLIRRCFSKIWS